MAKSWEGCRSLVTRRGICHAFTLLQPHPWCPFKNNLSFSFFHVRTCGLPSNIWINFLIKLRGLPPALYPTPATCLLLCLVPWRFLWTKLSNFLKHLILRDCFFLQKLNFADQGKSSTFSKLKRATGELSFFNKRQLPTKSRMTAFTVFLLLSKSQDGKLIIEQVTEIRKPSSL